MESMMVLIQDQVSKATQAGMASQLEIHTALTSKVMDRMQQVADLNLNLVRATLEHSNFAARQLMSAEDSQEFLSLAASQIQPNATRTFDYGYYLTTIAADTQADVIKVVGKINENNRQFIALTEDVRESVPCGFKAAITSLRMMMDNVACLYAELARIAQNGVRSLDRSHDMPTKWIAYAGVRPRRPAQK
jgi:phasin family protein